MQDRKKPIIVLGLLLTISQCVLSQRDARRISTGADMYKGFKSPCGSAEQISKRIGTCLDGVVGLLEGTVSEPKTDADLQFHCERFQIGERCARTGSKECLKGIHKTVVSAVPSAIKRWREKECKNQQTRSKYFKPIQCTIKKTRESIGVLRNHTAMLQTVRDMPIEVEQKLIKMCCILNSFDKELEWHLNKECPESTGTILNIVHALTDDARNTLCVNPRCSGVIEQLKGSKYKPSQSLLEPIVQIMFQMSSD